MSITDIFKHQHEDGIETYSFASEIQPEHRHLVDRVDDGPWQVWPIDLVDPLPLDTARIYLREVSELIVFAENLNRPAPRRSTEPGEPDLAGRGGGL